MRARYPRGAGRWPEPSARPPHPGAEQVPPSPPYQPPAPELLLCWAFARVVPHDRVCVVLAGGLDVRFPLDGSDAALRRFDDQQLSVLEGPGVDVLRTLAPVAVADLELTSRWPLLSATAPDTVFRSLAALPLVDAAGGDGRPLGVLYVARDRPTSFSAAEVRVLSPLADLLVASVLHRFDPEADPTGAGLSGVTAAYDDSLAVVTGLLSQRHGLGRQEVLARLRAAAFSRGCTVHELAGAVLAGDDVLADDADDG